VASVRVCCGAVIVRVTSEKPEDSDEEAANEDQQHFDPLVAASVELTHDDFAARHVDESAA